MQAQTAVIGGRMREILSQILSSMMDRSRIALSEDL